MLEDEEEIQSKSGIVCALVTWAFIIMTILTAIFLFIPVKTQIVFQRFKDRKYIRGEKK